MHWGDFKDNGCVAIGNGRKARVYSAILWDIPGGHSWEEACKTMPATINGRYFPCPTICVKTSIVDAVSVTATALSIAGFGFPAAGHAGTIVGLVATVLSSSGAGALNMWGVFYVEDGSCVPTGGGGDTPIQR